MTTHVRQMKLSCQICGRSFRPQEVMPAAMLHGALHDKIRAEYPQWSETGCICMEDLNRFRHEYIEDNLKAEHGELNALQQEVLASIKENETITRNLNDEFTDKSSFGEYVADKVAEFGGSWKFIISFGVVILVWLMFNSFALLVKPFDPFPFILLNLVLSCVASLQAPVIMMSQNRQEAKDRLRAEQDFRTNLKAELEIRTLHAKIDELITHQWQRLLDIQQIQVEMMEEMANHHQWERSTHGTEDVAVGTVSTTTVQE